MTPGLIAGTFAATQAAAVVLSATFVSYVLMVAVPFLRRRPRPAGFAGDFSWHLFVPARDEERVIAATVAHLRACFPVAHVWVIDDASTDATAAIVAAAAERDPGVHLVSRRLPDARTGKGDALNAAYRRLDAWLPATTDRARVIIGVVDADGRPAPDCLDMCAADGLLGDPAVGAVQVCVRIANRVERRPFPGRGRWANLFGRTLVRLQDVEFATAIAAIQHSRRRTGTVGLGGNGQFTRLSALDDVRRAFGRPWHGALLEDYELSLHLLLIGHRSEYTDDTWVEQEGLANCRRLLTQRTRWCQGTMQCARYLPRLWSCRHVSMTGMVEAGYFLLQPWLQLLGTLVYPLPLALVGYSVATHPSAVAASLAAGGWMVLVAYLVFGVCPFLVWGPIYARRCEPGLGWWRGFAISLAYAAFMMTHYVTSWRAFGRTVRGRRDWAKTQRNEAVRPEARPGVS